MKHKLSLMLLCLVAGVFVACKQGAGTGMAEMPIPELTELPSVTAAVFPEEDLVPIDAEHFTDEAFQRFISIKFDTNGDGLLSKTEREAVEEMDLSSWHLYNLGVELKCVDGLEYFPKLRRLELISLNEVSIKKHPSLEQLGGTEIGITELEIEDCPVLESVIFSYSKIEAITIKNCEGLKFFYTVRSTTEDVSGTWEFRNTPELIFCTDDSFSARKLILDADAVIAKDEHYTDMDKENMISLTKDGITLCDVCEVKMEEERKDSFTYVGFSLADSFTEADFEYMDVQIFGKTEDIYDEQGRKGWNVCIDLMENAYSRRSFSVYTEEQPEPEQIYVRPGEINKVDILEYSPNRGIAFKAKWDLEVVYRKETGEAVLGTMTEEQYWTIGADGTKKRYPSESEWKKDAGYVYQAYKELGWK